MKEIEADLLLVVRHAKAMLAEQPAARGVRSGASYSGLRLEEWRSSTSLLLPGLQDVLVSPRCVHRDAQKIYTKVHESS